MYKSRFCLIASLLSLVVTASAAVPKVTTVAGGYLGNGKPATQAALANPTAVATDTKGNIYISDSVNCQIRKVNRLGVISKFAGTGICGYSGDAGSAKYAKIFNPVGIAFDKQGNLLFADQGNSRIRNISPSGIISTIAGNGTVGYSGDGGPAAGASLDRPTGVSVDPAGNIYIADSYNYVIRKVDTAGIIYTVAGNHTWGFSGDGGPATSAQINLVSSVLADDSGNFYIADGAANGRVRRVDSSGIIATYAGNGQGGNLGDGGPATSASIGTPAGLLLGTNRLYISTGTNIWVVDLPTQTIRMIAGNAHPMRGFGGDGGPALSASFLWPAGLAFDAVGNLLIADSGNNRVRKIDASQSITTFAGGYLGDGLRATSASLSAGEQISLDAAGNLYFADTNNNRIRKVSPTRIITTAAGTGISGFSGDGGPAVSANLNSPSAVVADGNGNIFIADSGNSAIRKVDSNGMITTFSYAVFPAGLAMDSVGNLYTSDLGYDIVWRIAPDGSKTVFAGVTYGFGYNGDGIPATQAWVFFPLGLAVDGAGNLFIADTLNYRVRKVDTNGIITTVAGIGVYGYGGDGGPATEATLSWPTDVAVDTRGNLYIADGSRVRVVDPSGTINTYAGSGNDGYNGNNLPATATNLTVLGVATNPKGVVYVSDEGSFRVRKIH